ncbi:MAG TPA: response regulator transcription factor [Candidatus Acidoferrales bacterium]|nr:response regulator transcription factor [Candidatus Acidoferrales bacterium]
MGEGRILVVDDEPQIRRVMRSALVGEGYEVADARNGENAVERIRSEKYDLVLLDINMPGITGIEVCRQIRLVSDVCIIMMTVRHTESDKVEALDMGADDYVTKPFSMPEMLARIRAALRRPVSSSAGQSAHLQLGDVEIDFRARRVTAPHQQVRLSVTEFDLLSYFASHPNRAIPHEELLHAVWGPDYQEQREYLRVFINRLRKKIEPDPQDPKYLLKEPWIGYRLNVPER